MKMKLKTIYLLLLFTSFSCVDKTQESVRSIDVINDNYRNQFLVQALNDSLRYNLLHYKNPFIVQSQLNSNERKLTVINKELKKISLQSFLSKYLEENDTIFLSKQIDSLNTFDKSKLKNYGYKYINWQKLKRENLYSKDSILMLEKQIETDKIIWITKPIFNKKLNKAYIEVGHSICWSNALLYEKIDKNWRYNKTISSSQM